MKLRRSILTILIPSGVTLNDLGKASKHYEKWLANPSRHRSWALNGAGLCNPTRQLVPPAWLRCSALKLRLS